MAGRAFQRYTLGNLPAGCSVVVELSTGANVRLMTPADFSNYKTGRAYRYFGGLARTTPARITVPRSGEWILAVDLAGLAASSVTTKVTVRRAGLST
ncbi:DUF1883 domain-containing protein [Microbacterium sp. NPDC089696]|uniref:DUF1883 domain-containing protein n=1 Tax=Microbacterium sp. NPDC089696 TaxID=3364199 RepID=UPI00380DA594